VLTSRIALVFGLAAVMGAFSGVAGYAISFRGDLPVGATQSATAAALLVSALCWRAAAGRWRRRQARTVKAREAGGS
jgi:ABC-type Mn2+/Zn2+ transport system permease subunit